MPSTRSLIQTLKTDFPDLTFKTDDDFRWSFEDKLITYTGGDIDANAHLLHELSHAVLGHKEYDRDIGLIGLERDAWDYAKTILGPRYNQAIPEDTIKNSLDTYRDWLHARSTCPQCQATGFEVKKAHYHCPACTFDWRVNEARLCALRRYRI